MKNNIALKNSYLSGFYMAHNKCYEVFLNKMHFFEKLLLTGVFFGSI